MSHSTDVQVTTRLQSLHTRVTAQEGKMDQISTQMTDLATSFTSLKELMEKVLQHSSENPIPPGDNPIPPPSSDSLFSLPKVKIPVFDGADPRGWITKAELYFTVHKTLDSNKLKLSQMCMEGTALNWFTTLLFKHPLSTWEQFKAKLLVRFGGTQFLNAHEALGSLYQESDIEEYIEQFESLSALIPEQSEEQSLGMFLRGLQPTIRNWVRALRPNSCDTAMELARHVATATTIAADKPIYQRKPFTSGSWKGNSYSTPFSKPNPPTTAPVRPNFSSGPPNSKPPDPHRPTSSLYRSPGLKHLSKQEWEDRRRKGLCFSCGHKFSPGHKCTDGQFRVLLLTEEDQIDENGDLYTLESDPIDDEPVDGECHVLDSRGFTPDLSSTLRTLKLAGQLHGFTAIILIDGGATYNFISKTLVSALGLDISPTKPLSISLGDGTKVIMSEICRGIPLVLGPYSCTVDALVYDLGSLDIILGVAWLGPLGDVIFNWQKQEMRFWYQGATIHLRGISSNQPSHSLNSCLENHFNSIMVSQVPPTTLSASQQHQLNVVLEQFHLLFQSPQGLPPSRAIEHTINLFENQGPICVRPYRYPHLQKDEIQKQVDEMLSTGIIRLSNSAYSSPVILVRKKDSSWRLCIDYRALNRVTTPDKYPIPVVEELLDELHGSQFFSKIDLKSGFYQVRMRESDAHKTAFRTHNGHYEFLVMPFGLTNAPSTFQALMNDVFRSLLRKGVLVFFDDILIYSTCWDSHLHLLTQVLLLLQTHQLVINKKKSSFGIQSVEYLGHIISQHGVSMDPQKITAINTWPTPRNAKGVRGFLGLTGYYRKFIRGYGKIARPLTELTKKDGFDWSPATQSAFDLLKQTMTTAPLLTLPDFSKPFEIECDASGLGLGAVLMQSRKPIAYFSKALSDKNLTKSAYEKELMALVLAIQHWRPYLLGRDFTVFTDQKSLRHLLEQRITTTDQQNWLAKLMGYKFSILYKPGRDNTAADALSRVFETNELRSLLSYPRWLEGNSLLEGSEADPRLQKIISDLTTNPSSHSGFSLLNGKLYHKGKLVIPATSKWIPQLITEFHDSPSGGHSGFYRTYRRLAAQIYWIGMTKSIKDYVRACDTCQRYKHSTLSPAGLLQPLPIPTGIWDDISLDFITGLPKSKGFEMVLVVVDRLSKYCHFIPLKHPVTARSLAEIFVKEVIRLHGVPKSILSDRDPLFLSKFWTEIFKQQGSKLKFSSAYHPETDGQTEVVNRSLETYLRCFAAEQPKTWSHWLPWAEYWHNSAYHVSTNTTPFHVVYGRPPPTVFQFIPGEIRSAAVAIDLGDRDEALSQLKYHLARAQSYMKSYADKHRRDVEFSEGDWVFLKLRPHRQQSVIRRINQKLSPRYYGPFLIIGRVGPVAYRLQLPESSKVHPVFHVSLLKRAIGNHTAEPSLPPGLEMDSSSTPHPLQRLATRTITRGDSQIEEWLIQWDNQTVSEATWEDAFTVQTSFPSFGLEDKPFLQDAGIDKDQPTTSNKPTEPIPWRVYSRRKKVGQA
ncbi:hypothetical protein LXL04_035721 [Taraxacum kok-saghyz]